MRWRDQLGGGVRVGVSVALWLLACQSAAPVHQRSQRPSAPLVLEVESSPSPSPAPAPERQKTPPAELPAELTVLHIGDSFAGALGAELHKDFKAAGIRSIVKYEKSTYIPTWASKRELTTYLLRYKPDLVLVTLGANELNVPDPNVRIDPVRRLVARLGSVPCVWVGVPVWEGAPSDLMDVVRQHVSPCRYFDSSAALPELERARDNIHPSSAGRRQWADALLLWLRTHRRPDAEGWAWAGDGAGD